MLQLKIISILSVYKKFREYLFSKGILNLPGKNDFVKKRIYFLGNYD